MEKYKLAVCWTNGMHEGFVGYGRNEDAAKNDAIVKVIHEAAENGLGFTILGKYDIHKLPWSSKSAIEQDWEDEERSMAGVYP